MPRWPALMFALALAGCHVVFGFDGEIAERSDGGADGAVGDAEPDGPTCMVEACQFDDDLHDEDGDCTPDACDPCPHLARDEDDADEDGDGVGDGCDESTGDVSSAEFMSFAALEGFSTVGDASVAGDLLHLDTMMPQPAVAYYTVPSRPPYRVMMRMQIPDAFTFGGLTIAQTGTSGLLSGGYAVVLSRTNGQVTLAVHEIDDGDLVAAQDMTTFNSSSGRFALDVMVDVNSIEARATDLGSDLTHEITSFIGHPSIYAYDGVLLAPGQTGAFESWFRSQRQTSR